jgi:hypothetical protein
MKTITRLGVGVGVAVAVAVPAVPTVPAAAASTTTVAATGVLDPVPGGKCPPKHGYTDFPPIVMSGDLDGCWYSDSDNSWDLGAPSGRYFDVGHELFVGRIRGVGEGSFKATYMFESQYDPDFSSGNEVWGRCQHQITPRSGRGGMHGVTGYFVFTDVISDGHLVGYHVEGVVD